MNNLQEGSPAPAFSLPDQNNTMHSLDQYKGSWILLYFYPKDDTPGCTTEACGFRDIWKEIKEQNCVILGMSADSTKKHASFAEKFELPFPLLSDESKETIQAYDCWKEKSMYGKKYMGIERNSFLIDPEGNIARIYRKVKPKDHPQDVLNDLITLSS